MFRTALTRALTLATCALPVAALGQTATPGSSPLDDNRLIPVHAKICDGNVVDKSKLFFQLLANASPPLSDQLKFALGGDWRKLVTDKNICPHFAGCKAKDAQSINSIHLNYTVFVSAGAREGYYEASHPDLSIGEYFRSMDNKVNAIYCTSKDETPAAPPSSPIDANSPLRLRGISDDLWIDQKSPLFAKTSSAAASFVENDAKQGAHTNTTSVQAALGYDIPLVSTNSAFSHEIIPFAATNIYLTDTQNKPRVIAPTNFVSGGFLAENAITSAAARTPDAV